MVSATPIFVNTQADPSQYSGDALGLGVTYKKTHATGGGTGTNSITMNNVNDVEVGGETKFLSLYKPGTYIPFTVTPKRGRLLMFPPMWSWYHAGLKPESGKKYLIHSYCHYA